MTTLVIVIFSQSARGILDKGISLHPKKLFRARLKKLLHILEILRWIVFQSIENLHVFRDIIGVLPMGVMLTCYMHNHGVLLCGIPAEVTLPESIVKLIKLFLSRIISKTRKSIFLSSLLNFSKKNFPIFHIL